MGRYDAALLDVDGTLVTSNDAHARAWAHVLRSQGFDLPYERIRRLIGKGGALLVEDLTGLAAEDPRNESLGQQKSAVFEERYLREVGVFPGARELVDRLRAEGYAVVVASSSSRTGLRGLLARAELEDLLDSATSADDAEDPKPEPDIVEAAVRRAGVTPERAILIGDTPYDVEACRRAGVDIVAVRSGGWADEDLDGALAIYDDLSALLAAWDGSPLSSPSPRR